MRSVAVSAAASLCLCITAAATAQLPTYGFELQARSNFTGAFNLPDGAFFSNSTPRLNDAGRVAIDLSVVPGSTGQGVWWGGEGTGAIVHVTPAGSFVLDLEINAGGEVVFEQSDSAQDGLYVYDPNGGTTSLATNLPLGADGWGSPGIDAAGRLGYRARFAAGRAYASFDGSSMAAIHATEAGIDVGSPYSFLFTPSFNGNRQIAGKVRLGLAGQVDESQPDQIRIFEADGSSVLIAEDQDSDPGSPYIRFDNSVALTHKGWVAFVATLAGGARGVFLSNGTETQEIVTEDHPDVSAIEFFAPDANDDGLVAFRAFDGAGLRAVWVGNGEDLVALVREHELLETDLGTARIDQNDASPVFGGGPSINAAGDVAFIATLTPPDNDQVEWGSGVFLARAETPLFADGFESGDTTAWSATVGVP